MLRSLNELIGANDYALIEWAYFLKLHKEKEKQNRSLYNRHSVVFCCNDGNAN